jgi:hypothetical protein
MIGGRGTSNFARRMFREAGLDPAKHLRILQNTNSPELSFRARLSEGHTPQLELMGA